MSAEGIFTHDLQELKGLDVPFRLDKEATVAIGQVFNRGSVYHLDAATGQAVAGINGNSMPIFALNGTADADVRAHNVMGGLVASGGYELQSSEYTDDTYQYNDLLTAGVVGEPDAGIIKTGVVYSDLILGVVSKPPFANQYRVNVIQFWSVYIPALGARSV